MDANWKLAKVLGCHRFPVDARLRQAQVTRLQ